MMLDAKISNKQSANYKSVSNSIIGTNLQIDRKSL
jgi:hypothetical protein